MRKSLYKRTYKSSCCYYCDYLSCKYRKDRKEKSTKCPVYKDEMKGVQKRAFRRSEKIHKKLEGEKKLWRILVMRLEQLKLWRMT